MISRRNLEIYGRWRIGERVAAIAADSHISRSRVDQIIKGTERRLLATDETAPVFELGIRAQNCLFLFLAPHLPWSQRLTFMRSLTPGDIAKVDPVEFLRFPNAGRKSMNDIADWLARHGTPAAIVDAWRRRRK